MRPAFNTSPTARHRRLSLVALAASLLSACATGEQQDPSAPWDDEPVADAGYPDDTGSPLVDVHSARDVPSLPDVPSPRDAPAVTDAPSPRDVPAIDISPPVDVPIVRDVPVTPDVPLTCTGPTTQTCSTCGTQSRTCTAGVWSVWSTCALPALSIAGNWRFGIAPPGSSTTSLGLGWFAAGASSSAYTGGTVDSYGYAEFTAIAVDVCTRRVTFTKRYLYGTSTDSTFRYAGTHTAGTPANLSGTWVDVADSTNNSVFAARTSTGRTPVSFAGAWRITANWGTASSALTVTPSGGLTGSMTDTLGNSSLYGAVDFESGYLMFIKRYTNGTSVGQQYLYGATVNPAGAIVGGTWSFQGPTPLTGTWSAIR